MTGWNIEERTPANSGAAVYVPQGSREMGPNETSILRTQKAEIRGFYEFEANLVYIVSSRPARAT